MKEYTYIRNREEETQSTLYFKNEHITVGKHIDFTANMEAINNFLSMLVDNDSYDGMQDIYTDDILTLLNHAYNEHGKIIELRVYKAEVGSTDSAISPDAYGKIYARGSMLPIALYIEAQITFGRVSSDMYSMSICVEEVAYVTFNLCDLFFIGDDDSIAKFHANAYERFFTCNG